MTTTANNASIVDSERFTVSRTITIAAPIEKVWAAITEVEHIAMWLGSAAILDGLAVGSRGAFSFDGTGDVPVQIEELDPPRMIAYRWSNNDERGNHPAEVDPDHSTVFRFTLESQNGGTQLTVFESGFETTVDAAVSLESHRVGWNHELDELTAYVESNS